MGTCRRVRPDKRKNTTLCKKTTKRSAMAYATSTQGRFRANNQVPNNAMIPCSLATTAKGTAEGFCATNVDGASVCLSYPFTGTQVFQGPSSNLQVNSDHIPLGVGMAVCPTSIAGRSGGGGGQDVTFFASPWMPYTQSSYRTATLIRAPPPTIFGLDGTDAQECVRQTLTMRSASTEYLVDRPHTTRSRFIFGISWCARTSSQSISSGPSILVHGLSSNQAALRGKTGNAQ